MDGNFCAYLRKSRADEVREKLEDNYDALAHHRSTLSELAKRMNVEIIRWYSDGIKSGESIENRDGMKSLLEDITSNKWEGVLVVEIERLTRGGLADQATVLQAFSDTSTLIVTPNKVYDPESEADMEYFEFGMFMSRREFKTINKRLIAGRVASVREGQFIAKDAPYGYDKTKIDGMKTLVPNDSAEAVVAIYEMYSHGKSLRNIAAKLDLLGYKPLRGRKWNPASIKNIVSNPVYIGKVRWNATKQEVYFENGRRRYKTTTNKDALLYDGLHPAIISHELWDAAQNRQAAAPVRKQYEMRNYYGRVLVCAECGKALHYCDTGNATEPILVHKGKDGCKTKGCKISLLDRAIKKILTEMLKDVEVEINSGIPDNSYLIERFEAEAERCNQVVKDNLDRMERGILTEEEYIARKIELENKAREAKTEADKLRKQSDSAAHKQALTIQKAIDILDDPNASVEAKRLLIWGIFSKIEYQNRAKQGQNNIHLNCYIGNGLNMS